MDTDEKIKILMVDDSATNLLALEAILQDSDRNLVSASSGEDALRYLLTNEVAVILMDVYMPGLDGLETAELIRGRDKSRNIPIIFLTADSTGGRHLSRGYSLGAVDYIVKPIEPDILRSKVAVFVELFKKTQEVKEQAELLREKNLELENANLARLTMLIELGQKLASERDPWRVLENFCKSARQIIDAEESAVGMLGDDGDNLSYYFSCSVLEKTGSGERIPRVVKKALKQVVAKRVPVRLSETDQLLQEDDSTTVTIRSFLGTPIFSAARVCGWVYMLNKSNASEFSEADERLAATLATQVAISYENATLYTDAQSHATKLQLEITERKQAEVQRAEMLVREQAARAEAEQANRTKDEFLATLSHELRTPLTAILGWSHLVRTGKLEPVQLGRALETIERNARSQSQLIDDLLDVSRIITGKLQIEPRAVDLGTIIDAAVEAVRPSFEAKSIKLETTIEAESVVMGDANRLQQVFWNLLSNAVKFTPESGTVQIEVKRIPPFVRASVSDTGIGIKPEFLPFIFDRFRQADGSTTRVHGGLGLGLSIVKHLVQMHSGNVQVQSDGQDKGAMFSVEFPLASAASSPVSPNGSSREADPSSVPAGFSRILEGLRIVVVDDEADSRELVRAILTRCGGEVNCCDSAAAAMKAIREWKPDLLVSDIGMPVEDGYTLIRKVRKLRSKRSKLPAVALTAYATKEDKARALETGFQMHVAKPIEPETLVMSIASTVGRKM